MRFQGLLLLILIVLMPLYVAASSNYSIQWNSLDSVPLTKVEGAKLIASLEATKLLYQQRQSLFNLVDELRLQLSTKESIITALRADNGYLMDINNKQEQQIQLHANNYKLANEARQAAEKKSRRARNWQTVLFILGAAVGAGVTILILK
jgi:hypothetical protein